ncbi:MAG: GTP-binding protein [Rhodobacterales bacterium]|nr:MAG: GTP-binding protein [Rhodobacterales bacterium]
MSEGRLPLTLLGGALGSGKTTWARHQLHDGAFGTGVHVLVNEAAEVPVDDQLLARAEGVTVLAGGCVCCTGRQALVAALRDLCDRRSRGAGPQRVLLETSGLADPGAIAACLRADPILARHLRLDGILVAIDAVHALAQLTEDPLVHRQIAVADRLILTKVDVAKPQDVQWLQAGLAQRNPAAQIEGCQHGVSITLAPPLPAMAPNLPASPATQEPSVAAVLRLPVDLDWAETMVWLSALLHARGDRVVRVKGVIPSAAGRLLVQSVRGVVEPPELLPPQPRDGDGQLVFLGRGFSETALVQSLRGFLDLSGAELEGCSDQKNAISV